MSDSDLLALLLLAMVAFIVWCLACACLLAASRLVARAARAARHGARDVWERTAGRVLYALAEYGRLDDDPDLYAARAAAVDHHRITITGGPR